jgi:hypothetical protein
VRAYKEAFQGKGPRYNYEFYRLYRQIVGVPKLVIYGVDYFIFSIASEPWAMERFARPGAPPPREVRRGPLLMLANKEANDRGLVGLLGRLQRLVPAPESAPLDPDRNVRDMERYTGNPLTKVVERPAPAHFVKIPYPRFPGVEGQYLVELLRQLDADGVRVMFVYPPDYIATYLTDFEVEDFVRTFEQITANQCKGVFFNYNDPRRFPSSQPSYFVDGDYGNPNSHLSLKGIAQFNRLFLPDVKKMWALAAAHP